MKKLLLSLLLVGVSMSADAARKPKVVVEEIDEIVMAPEAAEGSEVATLKANITSKEKQIKKLLNEVKNLKVQQCHAEAYAEIAKKKAEQKSL